MGTTGMYRPPLPAEARIRTAGAGMRQIRTQKPNLLWLQGPNSDFWTWTDDAGVVMAHELTFFGRTVVWRADQILTGLAHEGDAAGVLGRTGQLDFDSRIDPVTLASALLVLSTLPANLKTPQVQAFEAAIVEAQKTAGSTSPPAR